MSTIVGASGPWSFAKMQADSPYHNWLLDFDFYGSSFRHSSRHLFMSRTRVCYHGPWRRRTIICSNCFFPFPSWYPYGSFELIFWHKSYSVAGPVCFLVSFLGALDLDCLSPLYGRETVMVGAWCFVPLHSQVLLPWCPFLFLPIISFQVATDDAHGVCISLSYKSFLILTMPYAWINE